MNIYPRRKLRSDGGEIQKRKGRIWESAASEFDMCFLGKDENGSTGHAFAYETEAVTDKQFLRKNSFT